MISDCAHVVGEDPSSSSASVTRVRSRLLEIFTRMSLSQRNLILHPIEPGLRRHHGRREEPLEAIMSALERTIRHGEKRVP